MVAAVAVVVASCGGDDDEAATTASSSAEVGPADTDVARSQAAAATTSPEGTTVHSSGPDTTTAAIDRTGETIRVGYLNAEGGAISFPDARIGGEVAVDAINADGGVNGATIELEVCLSDGTPEGAINCANQFVESGVAFVYAGFDPAADSALPVLAEADIPYISDRASGPAQADDDNTHILHAAPAAGTIAPLQALKDLGATKVALVTINTPVIQGFLDGIILPVGEGQLGLEIEPILLDSANADYAAAIGTAQASGADGMWGALGDAGCTQLATAAEQLAFDAPLVLGTCADYITELGDEALGTYTSGDMWLPEAAQYASAAVQENFATYAENMTSAGEADRIPTAAVSPYSSMFEVRDILATIPAGPIDAASIATAFDEATTTPGHLGPDLHCGERPWPGNRSVCRADQMVYEVVERDGELVREPIYDEFQDYSSLAG